MTNTDNNAFARDMIEAVVPENPDEHSLDEERASYGGNSSFDPKAAMNEAIESATHEEEQPPWRPVRASDPRPKKPVLIPGLLRRSLVMIISAKGKIGKTWLIGVQLAICVAFGLEWLGIRCGQGRVLVINPEVDEDSFDWRFKDMCELLGVDPVEASKRIDVWNTRKEPRTITEVAEAVEKFASGGYYSLIVLDSVSCYLEGDENSSKDVRELIGMINKMADASFASVVTVQHYGKGDQGARDQSDRARGSSVFLDAPDTCMTITEIFPPSGEVEDYLGEGESAYKVEVSRMREFGPFEPVNVIRKHPLVTVDKEGITSDWTLSRSNNGSEGGKASKAVHDANKERDFAKHVNALVSELLGREDAEQGISCKDAAELLGIGGKNPSQTLKDMFEEYGERFDFAQGEFTTRKAWRTSLLVCRLRPNKKDPSKEGQGYFIYPRFKVSQMKLDVDG